MLASFSRTLSLAQYYEAVYLMRRYMECLPMDSSSNRQIKRLLAEKANQYEQVASNLMNDDRSTIVPDYTSETSALTSTPQSPPSAASNTGLAFPDDASPALKQQQHCSSLRAKKSEAVNTIAEQANTKLAQALDLDESGKTAPAILSYMEAAELYLQAIPLCKKEQQKLEVRDALKHLLQQTLDRVEVLKRTRR
jgi:hypothetical protein